MEAVGSTDGTMDKSILSSSSSGAGGLLVSSSVALVAGESQFRSWCWDALVLLSAEAAEGIDTRRGCLFACCALVLACLLRPISIVFLVRAISSFEVCESKRVMILRICTVEATREEALKPGAVVKRGNRQSIAIEPQPSLEDTCWNLISPQHSAPRDKQQTLIFVVLALWFDWAVLVDRWSAYANKRTGRLSRRNSWISCFRPQRLQSMRAASHL